jgi:hypothetical protein
MVRLNETHVTDRTEQRTEVVLSRKDYLRLMEHLGDRMEIRKRKRNAKFVPWEIAKTRLKTR